jgi:pyocin large subunit-like protein
VSGRRAWLALLTIAIALAIVFGRRGATNGLEGAGRRDGSDEMQSAASAPRAQTSTESDRRGAARTTVRAGGGGASFRSSAQLDEHFAKHGAEFGRISEQEYLRRAQLLRDAPVGGSVEEIRRSDGVVSRFDRGSGAFIAFNADGTIRTFFKPNDGETYFRRQARRSH